MTIFAWTPIRILRFRDAMVSSPSQPATINDQNMAVNVIARRGAKKYRRSCEIIRITPAARGNPLENLPVANRVIAECGGVVRGHVPRRNRVHVDPLGGPFVRKRFRQLRNAALGCSVSGHQNSSLKGEQRSNVQDFAATPSLQHVPAGKL